MSEIELHRSAVNPSARAATQSALQGLNQALLHADDGRRRAVEAGDTDALMQGLETLTQFNQQLKVLVDSVKADLDRALGQGYHKVPDGEGWVEIGFTYDDKWDSRAVLDALVRKALDPEGTGEIPDSPTEIMARITDAIWECAPMTPNTSWRIKALTARKIDVRVHRTRTKKPTVKWAANPAPQVAERVLREAQP